MFSTFKSEPSESSSCLEEDTPIMQKEFPFKIVSIHPISNQKSDSQRRWNPKELLNYLAFLEVTFNEEYEQSDWAYYKKMSSFIGTRNPNQCRIKHIKMLKIHQSNLSILKAHKNQIANSESEYDLYKEQVSLDKENCSLLCNGTKKYEQKLVNQNTYQDSIDKFYEVFYPKLKNTETDIALNEGHS